MIVGGWRAARVDAIEDVTPSARVLRLSVPDWPGSEAGQHVDIRLTAEDGYQAERSYSLGSYGESQTIELAVDEIPEGEVSPYLVRDVLPGVSLGGTGYFVQGTEPVAEADLPPGVAAVRSLAEATELLLASRV